MKPINTNASAVLCLSSSRLFHKDEVTGKTVIDSTGKVTGMVKDVLFSISGEVMLVVAKKDGTEIQVPMSRVVGLSEYVVTRNDALPQTAQAPPQAQPECKFCGHEMGPTVYCPGCGKSQV